MFTGPITIDPTKISTKIAALETEAQRLREFLAELDGLSSLDEFRVSLNTSIQPVPANGSMFEPLPSSSKVGRPREKSGLLQKLRDFILSQNDTFSNFDLRGAVEGPEFRRDVYHAAVRQLVKDGVLDVIVQPTGRKVGEYRRKGGING